MQLSELTHFLTLKNKCLLCSMWGYTLYLKYDLNIVAILLNLHVLKEILNHSYCYSVLLGLGTFYILSHPGVKLSKGRTPIWTQGWLSLPIYPPLTEKFVKAKRSSELQSLPPLPSSLTKALPKKKTAPSYGSL